jgi:hypothetical protein
MSQELFEVGAGLSIDGEVVVLKGDLDPSVAGVDAPKGSLYLRTTGELWQKYDASPVSWRTAIQTDVVPDMNLDGGAAFTVFDPLTGVDGGTASG